MELNTIACGNCLELFKKIGDDTFDMTFADPPFNLDKKYKTYKDSIKDSEYLDWCLEWISEMFRVTSPTGTIFLHNIPKWLVRYVCMIDSEVPGNAELRHWISWDAATTPMGKSLQPAHYGILYYVKDPSQCKVYELRRPHQRCRDKKCNLLIKDYGGKKEQIHPVGPLISDVWTDIFRCKHDRYKDNHPCQLPIHLLERLILLCTDEGDSVLDCFMGTGTTAIAAKRLGRNFYGMELSQEYVKIAQSKLTQEDMESKFNNVWISCYLERFQTVRQDDMWDAEKKDFRQEWKDIYVDWPETNEDRAAVNSKGLELKEKYQKQLKKLCSFEATNKKGKKNGNGNGN